MKNAIIGGTLIIASFVGGQMTTSKEVELNPEIADQVQVTVKFKKTAKNGAEYNDALHYSLDEFSTLTIEKLEADKMERVTNYEKVVEEGSKRVSEPINEVNEIP